jgi:hypothetical protein
MGIRIPGAAVSAAAGAVEREASAAMRAVRSSIAPPAPKFVPSRSSTPVKDWSIPLLLGGAGLTYLMSPNEPSAPSSAPPDENADIRRVPMRGSEESFLPLPPSLERKQPKATAAPTFWDGIRAEAATMKAPNHFDQYDNEEDGKPIDVWLKEGLPATFDERFSGAQ